VWFTLCTPSARVKRSESRTRSTVLRWFERERWVSGECHARVFLRRGFGWFGVRGGAGRVGDGSCGISWAVTHFEGNAWRSASSICWPRGASVSVAAARG